MTQTAARVYNFLSLRSNLDNQDPRSSFKSKEEGVERAKYKSALLKISSSHWKSYLQNTINNKNLTGEHAFKVIITVQIYTNLKLKDLFQTT